MNREQLRNFRKNLKKSSLPEQVQEDIIERLLIQSSNPVSCYEGEKVRLDYARITSYKDWDRLRPEYKEFVEKHKNDIFTVEFDPVKKETKAENLETMVQLKEDPTVPKFLFWAGDLIPINGLDKNNKKSKKSELEEFTHKLDERIEELKNR